MPDAPGSANKHMAGMAIKKRPYTGNKMQVLSNIFKTAVNREHPVKNVQNVEIFLLSLYVKTVGRLLIHCSWRYCPQTDITFSHYYRLLLLKL